MCKTSSTCDINPTSSYKQKTCFQCALDSIFSSIIGSIELHVSSGMWLSVMLRREGESHGIKGWKKGRNECNGVVFESRAYFCIIRWPLDFSFWESFYAGHRPTPRNIFTKNVRCAAFAQKQETLNNSSVKKALLWQLVTAWELRMQHVLQNESSVILLHVGFHKLMPQSQHFTLRRQLLQW